MVTVACDHIIRSNQFQIIQHILLFESKTPEKYAAHFNIQVALQRSCMMLNVQLLACMDPLDIYKT
jgi:hypothetical protein